MKKFFKFVLAIGILGIFVFLLVAGTLALKIFFPAEKVKGLLLKELTSKLHREVSLDQVSLGLIHGLEIQRPSHLRSAKRLRRGRLFPSINWESACACCRS